MSALSSRIVIAAPADHVWEVIAGGFSRIGEWATAIPASAAVPPAPGADRPMAAPVEARVCQTGMPMLPQVTETIVAFDAGARTLTYEATDGMPGFVTAARNTWTVTALGAGQCQVDTVAEFTTRGVIGFLARALILARVARDGRYLLDDLKHFAETGRPSPRKRARIR